MLACEKKETVFVKTIDNQSNKEIAFYFHGYYNPNIYGDTVIIAAQQSQIIYKFYEENSSTPIAQPCEIYQDANDSVRVEVIGGGRLIKSLHQRDNWTILKSDNEQVCTFLITDADIK